MKTCPQCDAKYEFNMSFCLEDGSPLEIDNEAPTAQKIESADFPPHNTSANQPRETSPRAEPINSSMTTPVPHRRSYLGIIVGIFALGSFLLITLGIAGGLWWYSQTRVDNRPDDRTETTEHETKPTTTPAQTDKKTGALTMENYKKVKTGMTYKEVVEILGEEGDEMSSTDIAGYKTATYMWRSGTFTNVTLTFQNEKLMSKFQMGLD